MPFGLIPNFFLRTVCDTTLPGKQVVFTFDDGPDPAVTPQVLDILKEYNAQGTFFCIGKKIPDNEALLKRIHEEGHIIGNHSYSHAFLFDFFPFWTVAKELHQTSALIKTVTGKIPRFFRPPYGVTNPAISRSLRKKDYVVVGWNIRSLDTIIKDEDKVVERVLEQLKPGGIFLFHDTNPALPNILRHLLDYLKANDYQVANLDVAIEEPAYQKTHREGMLLPGSILNPQPSTLNGEAPQPLH